MTGTRDERRALARRVAHLMGTSTKKLAKEMIESDSGIVFIEDIEEVEEGETSAALMVLVALGDDAIDHVHMGLTLAGHVAEMSDEELKELGLILEDDDFEEEEE